MVQECASSLFLNCPVCYLLRLGLAQLKYLNILGVQIGALFSILGMKVAKWVQNWVCKG